MNNTQYLLGKLAEEALEVSHRAMKAQQFGLGETQKGQEKNNGERLLEELHDLAAIVQMLSTEDIIHYVRDEVKQAHKIEKVQRYRAYSIALGEVESS